MVWEVADVALNGHPMTEENEKALFGTRFEKLGQERRIQVLSAYGLIDEEARQIRQNQGDQTRLFASLVARPRLVAEGCRKKLLRRRSTCGHDDWAGFPRREDRDSSTTRDIFGTQSVYRPRRETDSSRPRQREFQESEESRENELRACR